MRVSASAPAKVILCGEHAVVYGYPAIALPVAAVAATATVQTGTEAGIVVEIPDMGGRIRLDMETTHPLADLIGKTIETLGVEGSEPLSIVLESRIPIASGMGSGAALGAAVVGALARYYGVELGPAAISALVYESERHYHGTPSGIDNTVVSYARPIWYRRHGTTVPIVESIAIGAALTLVVGDTGVRCPTRITVGGVRERRDADPAAYDAIFSSIGETVEAVRKALGAGDLRRIGDLLDHNHHLLQAIGVSSPELDRLVDAARLAGAAGAKLSGGGGGGIMLAMVEPGLAWRVEVALRRVGAVRVIVAPLAPAGPEAVLV